MPAVGPALVLAETIKEPLTLEPAVLKGRGNSTDRCVQLVVSE